MKKLIAVLSLVVFTVLASPAYAQTNQNKGVVETTKEVVSTNLNEVIIDMLRGVKTASGEIYQASKTAISKSVDFTIEQAPLVVKEFLMWRFVEALIWTLAFIAVACAVFYFASRIYKWGKDYDDDACILAWVMRIVATGMIVGTLTTNGMTMAKIKVAPRVYLIEYVVGQIQAHR